MKPAAASYLKSALALGLVAIIGTTLLSGVDRLTAERIAQQERRVVLEQLGQIIPPDLYDNALQDDRFVFADESGFPQGQQVVAYRARRDGQPVAVVLRFDAVDGYNGHIGLLLGIYADGRVAGVRVTSHRETPGLGDAIEIEKSNWVLGFDGASLGAPPPTEWTVQRDGGVFDQFTGATITPRAVVKAVRRALEYHEGNRERLYNTAADTSNKAAP
jgi:electron transport complex protein RnfG